MKTHSILGTHIFGEFYGVDYHLLNDENTIKNAILMAVEKSNMHLVKLEIVKFEPHGITGFGVLSESHISIHTYPEHNAMCCDIYTCGIKSNVQQVIDILDEIFKPKEKKLTKVLRGV